MGAYSDIMLDREDGGSRSEGWPKRSVPRRKELCGIAASWSGAKGGKGAVDSRGLGIESRPHY